MTAMGLDKKLQKQYGADYIGTEEYFETIDKTMRKRFPEKFEDAQSDEDDEPPPNKRTSEPAYEDDPPRRATKPAAVVAPASRSTPPNRIKLKGSEAAIARRLGVPIEEYAKQVAKLRRGE
jgi:cell division protein FtsN